MIKEVARSLVATLALALLLCGAYPAAVWGIAQIFPSRSRGSLIERQGKIVGSELIGQHFAGDRYFSSRPSAAGNGYDAANSGGSNLGPLSKKLIDGVTENVAAYRKQNNLDEKTPVPADAVLASASGLDPHISVKNALLQAPRVSKTRAMREEIVRHFIDQYTEGRDLGVFGEPRVNVFLLNLALDDHPSNGEQKSGGK
jgi:K+-transporting ATPase ATPase C chain